MKEKSIRVRCTAAEKAAWKAAFENVSEKARVLLNRAAKKAKKGGKQ
jgi:hypothetical protein